MERRASLGLHSDDARAARVPLTPIGIATAGPSAAAIGAPATMVAGGTLSTFVSLSPFIPGVRDPERVDRA